VLARMPALTSASCGQCGLTYCQNRDSTRPLCRQAGQAPPGSGRSLPHTPHVRFSSSAGANTGALPSLQAFVIAWATNQVRHTRRGAGDQLVSDVSGKDLERHLADVMDRAHFVNAREREVDLRPRRAVFIAERHEALVGYDEPAAAECPVFREVGVRGKKDPLRLAQAAMNVFGFRHDCSACMDIVRLPLPGKWRLPSIGTPQLAGTQ